MTPNLAGGCTPPLITRILRGIRDATSMDLSLYLPPQDTQQF
jgi:hypothetical protein